MMSYKQWLVLLGMYVVFMLMGAVGFLYLEEDKELAERANLLALKRHVIDVVCGLDNGSRGPVENMMKAVGEECGHDFLQLIQDRPLTWSLWNSFFFTFTVITTIGYGHMYPATSWGRIFCIVYAFVGVPFNGILVASLADLFSSKVGQDLLGFTAKVCTYAVRLSWTGGYSNAAPLAGSAFRPSWAQFHPFVFMFRLQVLISLLLVLIPHLVLISQLLGS